MLSTSAKRCLGRAARSSHRCRCFTLTSRIRLFTFHVTWVCNDGRVRKNTGLQSGGVPASAVHLDWPGTAGCRSFLTSHPALVRAFPNAPSSESSESSERGLRRPKSQAEQSGEQRQRRVMATLLAELTRGDFLPLLRLVEGRAMARPIGPASTRSASRLGTELCVETRPVDDEPFVLPLGNRIDAVMGRDGKNQSLSIHFQEFDMRRDFQAGRRGR